MLGPERELIGLYGGLSCGRPLELAGYPILKFGLTRISVVQASSTLLLGVQILRDLLGRNCIGLLLRYIKLRLLELRSLLIEAVPS